VPEIPVPSPGGVGEPEGGSSTLPSSASARTSLRTAGALTQSCDPSNFTRRVKTDKTSYSIAETVHIALSILNKGDLAGPSALDPSLWLFGASFCAGSERSDALVRIREWSSGGHVRKCLAGGPRRTF